MTTVGTVGRPVPAIRVRPVPPLDPPFDDEVAPDAWASAFGAAQLPLDWLGTAQRSAQRPDQTPDRTGAGGLVGDAPIGSGAGTPTAVAGASVEAKAAVRRFVGLCLEILNGYRPVSHLRPLVDPAAGLAIPSEVTAAVARVGELRRRTGAPRGRPDAVRVRRLRVCEPRTGAAEASVVLSTAGRAWALAVRLERRDRGWAATAVHLV